MGALDNPSVALKQPDPRFRKRKWWKGLLDNCDSLEQSTRGNLVDPVRGDELVRASDRCAQAHTGHCSRRGMYDTTGLDPRTRMARRDNDLDPLWGR